MNVYYVKLVVESGLLGTRDYDAIFIPDLEMIFGIAYLKNTDKKKKAWLEYRNDLCKALNDHIQNTKTRSMIITWKESDLKSDLLMEIISTANFVKKNPKEESAFAARQVKTTVNFDETEESLYEICSGRAIKKAIF